ncbi:MAG: hypothetical protein M3Q06_11520 [Bacteroidota bacterium]|nr:hypothetical protein [Bacteroidota bacterium]
MQQEFISSYGKVVLENRVLFVRKLKPSLTFSEGSWVLFRVFIVARFVIYLFEDDSPKRNASLVVLGLLSLFYGFELGSKLYKMLTKQSFANRIPLQKIKSYRLEEDTNGLEVHLFLQLHTGRERKIAFRKLEKQHEELMIILAQNQPASSFAY